MSEYYPEITDENFQEKLLMHNEFNQLIEPIINDKELTNEQKLEKIKSIFIKEALIPLKHQLFVSRFISSYTPYQSILLYHSPGSGKTYSVLLILKANFDFIINKNGMIYITVPSKIIKNQWIEDIKKIVPELINYITVLTNKALQIRTVGLKKNVVKLSTDSEKQTSLIKINRENEVDEKKKIVNMNNSILILEEAHNLTNNDFVEMMNYIKENSVDLKIIALTATPIKNKMTEIIDLFNFLLDKDEQLNQKDYFKISKNKITLINKDKLSEKMRGRVSTVMLNDHPSLAKAVVMGEFTHGLKLIKTINIKASKIQNYIITEILKIKSDALGRTFESLSDMILPYFNNKGKMIPVYGNQGFYLLKNQLEENTNLFNARLNNLLKLKRYTNLLQLTESGELHGKFFNLEYMRHFSSKYCFFIELIGYLNGNIFVYAFYQIIGLKILREMLINDGYENYVDQNAGDYKLKRCYICKKRQMDHNKIDDHTFGPIRFYILDTNDNNFPQYMEIFNNPENLDGKFIKMILGSRSINEGVTLKNVIHVIKIDGVLTMGREEQIRRRAIRMYSHVDFLSKYRRMPNVYIYNLALITSKGSLEINNYKLAESKYEDIKIINELLKEASIDKNVYDAKEPYKGKKTNLTESLIMKDNRVKVIIEYITRLLKMRSTIELKSLLDDLKIQFNDLSVMIAIKYLNENNKLFINKINDEFYIISNMLENKFVIDEENLLDIYKFYQNKLELVTKSTTKAYIYDFDYINNRTYYKISSVIGNKFKFKFSNDLIDKLNLNFVKTNKISNLSNKNIDRGWICDQSIDKNNMNIIIDFLRLREQIDDITNKNNGFINNKTICQLMQEYFILLEKYSNNNIFYVIIPKNHETLAFPLNIYDRKKIEILNLESKGNKIIDEQLVKLNKFVISPDNDKYEYVKFIIKYINLQNEEITYIIE